MYQLLPPNTVAAAYRGAAALFLGTLISACLLACKGAQYENTRNQKHLASDDPFEADAKGREGKDDGYLRWSSGSLLVADTFKDSGTLAALLQEMRDKKASVSLSMLLSGGWSLEDPLKYQEDEEDGASPAPGEHDQIIAIADSPTVGSNKIKGCKASLGRVGFYSVELSFKDDDLKISFDDHDFMSDRTQKRVRAALGAGAYGLEDMYILRRKSFPVASVIDPQYCAPPAMHNYDETHNRSPSTGCNPESTTLVPYVASKQRCFRYIYASQHAGYSVEDDLPKKATVSPSQDPDFKSPKLEIFFTAPKLRRVATLRGGGLKYFLNAYDRELAGLIKSSADKQVFRSAAARGRGPRRWCSNRDKAQIIRSLNALKHHYRRA